MGRTSIGCNSPQAVIWLPKYRLNRIISDHDPPPITSTAFSANNNRFDHLPNGSSYRPPHSRSTPDGIPRIRTDKFTEGAFVCGCWLFISVEQGFHCKIWNEDQWIFDDILPSEDPFLVKPPIFQISPLIEPTRIVGEQQHCCDGDARHHREDRNGCRTLVPEKCE